MAALFTSATLLATPSTLALSHRFIPPLVANAQPSSRIVLVYLHGLDSSSTTWNSFLEHGDGGTPPLHRTFPSYCIDLRGHGRSELGSPEEFSSASVAGDVLDFISSVSRGGKDGFDKRVGGEERPKVVLVGHSMGGRVAMLAAARATSHDVAPKLPFTLGALVVEDIDIKVRPPPFNVSWGEGNFDRKFSTLEECKKALLNAGYDESRILSWIADGRIRELDGEGGGWWTDVNPQARQLSYEKILNSDCGAIALDTLEDNDFAECTTFVIAGSGKGMLGTVCDKESLEKMRRRLRGCDYMVVEGAGHSIHKTHKGVFGNILDGVCQGLN